MTTILAIISRAAAMACCGAALLWWGNGFSAALGNKSVSGKAVFLVTPATRISLGSVEYDHVMVHSVERGTQLEFSDSDLFKNCTLLRTGTCDLLRGRGSCFGYHIFESSEGDRLLAKFSGVMLPESSSKKKPPEVIVRGTWVFVKGNGKFTDIKGGGSYKGRYTSTTEYELEWSGELVKSAQQDNSHFSQDGEHHVP